MRRPFRSTPPDRRAARLLAMATRRSSCELDAYPSPLPASSPAPSPTGAPPPFGPAGLPVAGDAIRRGVTAIHDVEARRRRAVGWVSRAAAPHAEPRPTLVCQLTELRTAVDVLVCGLRAGGAPIERVLPQVKALVREAETAERWRDPADTLMAQVVRWSIEAYYDECGGRGLRDA